MRGHLRYLAPPRFAGSWGPGLSHQPTPTSPCGSIHLPPELGPGLGINRANTLLDLCWFLFWYHLRLSSSWPFVLCLPQLSLELCLPRRCML